MMCELIIFKKTLLKSVFMQLLLLSMVFSQQALNFTVAQLEGSASVQHSEQYQWNKVATGDLIQKNDIFETDFQTKLQLSLNGTIVVLGSNTKTLIDFKTRGLNDSINTEISVTVFSGGVLTKSSRGCKLRVFTTNAVAETDSATLSTVADGKTGESGFQVISGNVNVRNITQSKGKILRSGLTTMVLPNKEPSAALYLTNRHVTVLKHFFGDEYIQLELDQAGVKPTEEKAGNRLTISKNVSSRTPSPVNDDMYKILFDAEKIYGSIIDDQVNNYGFYRHYSMVNNITRKKARLTLGTLQGAGNDKTYSSYMLTGAWNYKFIDFGLRFGLYREQQDRFSMNFTSAEGLLDKIDHFTLGYPSDSLFIELGGICDLTYGNGLVVDNFGNTHKGSIYHTTGVNAHAKFNNEVSIKGFLADVLNPYVGGFYLGYEPSSYYLGLGYYFDLDQCYKIVNNDNYKYSIPAFRDTIKPGPRNIEVHIVQLLAGLDLALNYEFHARIFGEFAQKMHDKHSDGRILRLPSLYVDFYKSHVWLSLFIETERLSNGVFNEFYMMHRNFVNGDTATHNYTIETVNSMFSKDRRAIGVTAKYGFNPVKGLDISLLYTQNFYERNTFTDIVDSTETKFPLNYSIKASVGVNDLLLRYIKYAGGYFTQRNATYFPNGGKPAVSWQAEAGFDLQTIPLFYNIALESQLRYFYMENTATQNTVINKDDHIIEWYCGIVWGFL
jgi:hypothetical protein